MAIKAQANFSANYTSTTTSKKTYSYKQVTTTTYVSNSGGQFGVNFGQYEEQIRQKYQDQLRDLESKVSKYQEEIKQKENDFVNISSTFDTERKKWDAEKKNVEFHLHRIRNERNEKTKQMEKFEKIVFDTKIQLSMLLKEKTTLEFKLKDYDNKLQDFFREKEAKAKKLQEMEDKLRKAENDYIEEQKDDLEYEETIRRQKELIVGLRQQIVSWEEENRRDDTEIEQLKNRIKQQEEELAAKNETIKDKDTIIEVKEDAIKVFQENIGHLSSQLDIAKNEREEAKNQLNGKQEVVKGLEVRIKNYMSLYSNLQENFNEIKTKIVVYERTELDLKKKIDEILTSFNEKKRESESYFSKVKTFENSIIPKKDYKIQSLKADLDKIKSERDDKEKRLKELNNKYSEMTEKYNKGLIEAQSKDNALIQEIEKQNKVIREWQEENKRDDAEIAELGGKCKLFEDVIGTLTKKIGEVHEKCSTYSNVVLEFDLDDPESTDKELAQFQKDVEQSQAFISLKEKNIILENTNKNLRDEVAVYRKQRQDILAEKNQIVFENETLKRDIEVQKLKIEQYGQYQLTYEEKVSSLSKKLEVEKARFATANDIVNKFKSFCVSIRDEKELVYTSIEEYLASFGDKLFHLITRSQAQEQTKLEIVGGLKNSKTGQFLTNTNGIVITLKAKEGDNKVHKAQFNNEKFHFDPLSPGIYVVEINAPNYIDLTFEKELAKETYQIEGFWDLTISPKLADTEWSAVLTWSEQPKDLDSIVVMPDGEKISYQKKASSNGKVKLDTDNTKGFGPETISITNNFLSSGQKISYYVHNYSRETQLSGKSSARVELYNGSKFVDRFAVPSEGQGEFWHVFDLISDTVNPLQPVQKLKQDY